MPTPNPPRKLPLFLDLSDCRVLLVGGGRTAEARLGALRAAGAGIRSVAIRHSESFLREAERLGGVDLIPGPYQSAHLEGVRLAVSATNDPRTNSQVAREARARGIFCNAVDDPKACDAFFAATFCRGPWRLAIGTDGTFPGLSRALREVLELLIPPNHGSTIQELGRLRQQLRASLPDPELRRQRVERLVRAFRRVYFPTKENPS
ncbi:MAG: bifunctional precorrin-2 dehydrogenase/sirohydrochlorin ferrochelatase [Holophaga sp.]|nr:bifunctional precorrin-2 dehydrogenase/sirohydrochlorin ferrochelatase [Holophaga sp.]